MSFLFLSTGWDGFIKKYHGLLLALLSEFLLRMISKKNILVLITKAIALSLIIGFTIGAFYLDKYININNVECLNNDCLDKRHGKKMV